MPPSRWVYNHFGVVSIGNLLFLHDRLIPDTNSPDDTKQSRYGTELNAKHCISYSATLRYSSQ